MSYLTDCSALDLSITSFSIIFFHELLDGLCRGFDFLEIFSQYMPWQVLSCISIQLDSLLSDKALDPTSCWSLSCSLHCVSLTHVIFIFVLSSYIVPSYHRYFDQRALVTDPASEMAKFEFLVLHQNFHLIISLSHYL